MPATGDSRPVRSVGTGQAAPHRLRPLGRRTHAAECSHGHRVTANVHRDDRHADHESGGACREQQRDGAPVAVADEVYRLVVAPAEDGTKVGDILLEHVRGEGPVVR